MVTILIPILLVENLQYFCSTSFIIFFMFMYMDNTVQLPGAYMNPTVVHDVHDTNYITNSGYMTFPDIS